MKVDAVVRSVDRALPHLVEWLVRFAEILLLAALFAFAATRTHNWFLWSVAGLLCLAVGAHVWLALRALARQIDPEGMKRAEAGEEIAVSKTAVAVSGIIGGLLGFAVGAQTVKVVWQMVVTNAL